MRRVFPARPARAFPEGIAGARRKIASTTPREETCTVKLSDHFKTRQPSSIRAASIRFAARRDGAQAINVAIGNVSLAMHPAMIERMRNLGSAFPDGVVKYTATVGTDECRQAFLNVIGASGCSTEGLHCQITDGGSQAMELVLLGVCGPAGTREAPLLLIDAAYTNYKSFAERLGRATVSIHRHLEEHGKFCLPEMHHIEKVIRERKPGALLVIPYDNPTGHYYDHDMMVQLGRLCVQHNLWMISDEAYRELCYTGQRMSSVWALTEAEVPGIAGRRISIETASKVWNACGLRIGALVTDNQEFHTRAVAENTASLCPNTLGQHIFGALAHLPHAELQQWFERQRAYYRSMLGDFARRTKELLPRAIVSSPDAALYSVVDFRRMAPDFDAMDFVMWCASEGAVEQDGQRMTLLTAPMEGFYDDPKSGRTQLRIAYVETPERMQRVPDLLAALVTEYLARRSQAVAR
ncbi:MAG: aminotransferase class I/II-fold pyridoxal phosphate-dependent enzyme [Candidatus Eremiobacterota bacterium]